MGSIIKTISLDGRTQKIADSIPNFSGWVRAKLLELEEKRLTPRIGHEYHCPICQHFWVYSKIKHDKTFCQKKDCTNYMFTPINEYYVEVDLE